MTDAPNRQPWISRFIKARPETESARAIVELIRSHPDHWKCETWLLDVSLTHSRGITISYDNYLYARRKLCMPIFAGIVVSSNGHDWKPGFNARRIIWYQGIRHWLKWEVARDAAAVEQSVQALRLKLRHAGKR